MSRTGRCLCGAVQYELTGKPLFIAVCHCRNCQRQSGSAMSIVVLAAAEQVAVSGKLKTYEDTADSGERLERRFCPECGSALFSWQPKSPETLIIKAGTLDDITWLKPMAHVWCASTQPWVLLPDDIPCLPANPPNA